MSGAAGGDDVEALAEALSVGAHDGFYLYGFLGPSWLAERLRAERAEGAREALEEAADDSLNIAFAANEDVRDWLYARAAAHATQEPTSGEGA